MNYNYLKNIVIEKEKEIKKLQSEIKVFKELHQPEFNKYVKTKQDDDKKWFINHFDYILRHKDYLMNHSPFKDIIIDFLPIYQSGGLCAGVGYNIQYNKISLSNLIDSWNNGYTYNDKPLIGYKTSNHNGLKHKWFSYIENNKEVSVQDDNYNDKQIKNISDKCSDISFWNDYKTIDILKNT